MKRSAWLFFIICLGCACKPKTATVHIALINNNRSIKFTGLDFAVVTEINRDSSNAIWQALIPVYRMPADTDMKDYQPVQPGNYLLKDSGVVFTPDTSFVKGQTYYLRYFKFGEGQQMWDFIKHKQRLGNANHTDLVFKP